jgi:restriction system protein
VLQVLARILGPLLSLEGYELSSATEGKDKEIDFVAKRIAPAGPPGSIAIEYKHFGQGRPLGEVQVRELQVNPNLSSHDRVMLISRFGFTGSVLDIAHRTEPVRLDLLDLRDIEVWIERREREQPDQGARVHLLIRSISHKFAKMVAENPSVLDHLEWRDLERVMARVMEGLGFDVTLTPPSKDGGKDLILRCDATRGKESYIVELKHWRSGKRVGKQSVSDFMEINHSSGFRNR